MDEIINCVDIILPNQLFEKSVLTSNKNQKIIVEEELYFSQYKFHKQKLLFHRMSMKNYQEYLESNGFVVSYIDSNEEISSIIQLVEFLSKKYKKIELIDPEDYLLERRLKKICKEKNISLTFHENKSFITTKNELSTFFNPDKKKIFPNNFLQGSEEKIKYTFG